MTQANTAQTRLSQKLGEFLQVERRVQVLGEVPPDETPIGERIESALDQYEDQVIRKEIAAAELDCKHARRAMQDILGDARQRQLLGFKPDPEMWQKIDKLAKIAAECLGAFRVSGESNSVKFSGQICSLNKPFVIDATFPGNGSAKTSFTPSSVTSGATSVSGGGGECVQSGGGQYNVTIKEDGSGTITWTTTDTLTCPQFSNTRTTTFTLPLQPAPEISCP